MMLELSLSRLGRAGQTKIHGRVDEDRVDEGMVDEDRVDEDRVDEDRVDEGMVDEDRADEDVHTSKLRVVRLWRVTSSQGTRGSTMERAM